MISFKNVLVPVDFLAEAAFALETAVHLAEREGRSRVSLIHIVPYLQTSSHKSDVFHEALRKGQDAIAKELDRWLARVPPGRRGAAVLRRGDVAEEIDRAARAAKSTAIVMTTRGRTGLNRLLQPNTSEQVVRLCRVPVLVLHVQRKLAARSRRGRKR